MQIDATQHSEGPHSRPEHAVGVIFAGILGYPVALAGVMIVATVCATLFG